MVRDIQNIRWMAIPFRFNVPKICGLYAIEHTQSYGGLEIENTFVYIGQTSNLNKRFNQHLPQNEQNYKLSKYVAKNMMKLKFWYTTLRGINQLEKIQMEKKLIRHFKPDYNTRSLCK